MVSLSGESEEVDEQAEGGAPDAHVCAQRYRPDKAEERHPNMRFQVTSPTAPSALTPFFRCHAATAAFVFTP